MIKRIKAVFWKSHSCLEHQDRQSWPYLIIAKLSGRKKLSFDMPFSSVRTMPTRKPRSQNSPVPEKVRSLLKYVRPSRPVPQKGENVDIDGRLFNIKKNGKLYRFR